jgi:peptidyl-prolyl cis-trans isomerase SurA
MSMADPIAMDGTFSTNVTTARHHSTSSNRKVGLEPNQNYITKPSLTSARAWNSLSRSFSAKLFSRIRISTGYNVVMNRTSRFPRGAFRPGIILAFISLLTLSACSHPTRPDDRVWAEVDGKPIYRDQVERYYRARMAAGSDAASQEQVLSFKLNILNELINNQILVDHAAKSHITVSEAEVDTKTNELQSPYSREEFQKKLAEQGLDAASLRAEVRQNLIITKLVNKAIVSRINVTDQEISAYYERNRGTFNVPETQYHLAQIAVTPASESAVRNTKNDDAKNPAAAERKIQALYARLRAGDDFASLAQEYSEDPRTSTSGGDMGFLPSSALDSNPTLKKAITSLRPGEMTPILRSGDGFHIIKLLGKEPAGQRELSDPRVQSSIRQTLTNEREQLLRAAFLEDLRNRANVVNYLAEKVEASGGNPALVK